MVNTKSIREIYSQLSKEYDLTRRLSRYESNKELMDLIKEKSGLSDDYLASGALFISDYIVTSSEVPREASDNDRRLAIADTLQTALEHRKTKKEQELISLYFIAYKLANKIRNRDLFMGSKGLDRVTALLKIKDAYVTPYLYFMQELLGEGPCDFELAILEAALLRDYPNKNLSSTTSSFSLQVTDHSVLIPAIWNLLQKYRIAFKVERNPTFIVPHILQSSAVLTLKPNNIELLSSYQTTGVTEHTTDCDKVKRFASAVQKLDNKLKMNLIAITALVEGTNERIFIVRNQYPSLTIDNSSSSNLGDAFFVLRTPSTDINITRTHQLLTLREQEADGWLKTRLDVESAVKGLKPSKTEVSVESGQNKSQADQETENIETDISDKSSTPSIWTKIKSFLGKLFGSDQEETTQTEVKIRKKRKKTLNDKFAFALTLDSQETIILSEVFDNIRESNYVIRSITEFDKAEQKTQSFTYENFDPHHETILEYNVHVEELVTHFISELTTIIPEEMFFLKRTFNVENDYIEDQKYLYCFANDTDRRLKIAAKSYISKIGSPHRDHDILEELIVSRRTVRMRTNQLLKARKNIRHFDSAVERILKRDVMLERMK